ncbi:hypothetical protein B9Z55_008003 [Caenorhabditis nigoni]|uniref:Uncharacterized protein n=1 Tax=Caenorhabditis nigoni TaxID=1611254 RepID=A0A2G5VC64_9PELO|nr:hypothetical protein B9Z55_008003 [Caenorhabditis nigoni]
MSYIHNSYHYQIAVASAIVIGVVNLLAGVAYAIYVVVLKDILGDDKQRVHPARSSAQWTQASQQFKQTEPKFKNAGTQTTKNDYSEILQHSIVQKCEKSAEEESRQMIAFKLPDCLPEKSEKEI